MDKFAAGILRWIVSAVCGDIVCSMHHRRYVEHILAGRFDRVQLPSPRITLEEIDSLASRAHAYASVPGAFPEPRLVAVALGFTLLPRAPAGLCGDAVVGSRIAFRFDPDERITSLRIAHGLAHAILVDETEDASDATAWILTARLIVPRRYASEPATPWAPEWFVEAASAMDSVGIAQAS